MLNMYVWLYFIGNFNILFYYFLFNNELYDMVNVVVFNIFVCISYVYEFLCEFNFCIFYIEFIY